MRETRREFFAKLRANKLYFRSVTATKAYRWRIDADISQMVIAHHDIKESTCYTYACTSSTRMRTIIPFNSRVHFNSAFSSGSTMMWTSEPTFDGSSQKSSCSDKYNSHVKSKRSLFYNIKILLIKLVQEHRIYCVTLDCMHRVTYNNIQHTLKA